MKQLYIECRSGVAGDMLLGALIDLMDDKAGFVKKLNSLLDGVDVTLERDSSSGIIGSHVRVVVNGEEEGAAGQTHEHHHHHSSPEHIRGIIDRLDIPDAAKKNALSIYASLAEAESKAHGVPVGDIHFHEVGTKDAIIDIAGVCLAIDSLSPDSIVSSPINVGSGTVQTAHGLLPVPAPATAILLEGIPSYGSDVESELCTPTGAACVSFFTDSFGNMPAMTFKKIGYGFGAKKLPLLNCVRCFLGEAEAGNVAPDDTVFEISANIDDCSAEQTAFTAELLLESGALDVFHTPIFMKKNRPAYMLTCICREQDLRAMSELILKHTSSFGVRYRKCERFKLDVSFDVKHTEYGDIRIKHGDGHGVSKQKPEFEDIARAARTADMSIAEIIDRL